jgi:hypothetical protein
MASHIPDQGDQLVRYSGFYSNASRGLRQKEKMLSLFLLFLLDSPFSFFYTLIVSLVTFQKQSLRTLGKVRKVQLVEKPTEQS